MKPSQLETQNQSMQLSIFGLMCEGFPKFLAKKRKRTPVPAMFGWLMDRQVEECRLRATLGYSITANSVMRQTVKGGTKTRN